MFAIPGITALIFFLIARPQEHFEILAKIPMLYLLCGAALGGFIIDLKLRRLQPVMAPNFRWVLTFALWALLCDVIVSPATVTKQAIELAILMVVYVVLGHSVQRFRAFRFVAGAIMMTALFLTAICFHQGLAPKQCVAFDPADQEAGTIEDSPCETHEECQEAGDGMDYMCEHVGLLGTFSVDDRVRYRGELQDPNELALTICIFGLSMIIAFMVSQRHPATLFFGSIAIAVLVATVFMTKSRGGLLVAMMVPGVYVVKRYGARALILGGALAAPVLALGGRSGSKADASTELRYEAWAAGLRMFKQSPLFGVGHRNFAEHHFLTAHNSFVLTMAELGLIGLTLFIIMLYISFKTLVVGLIELHANPAAASARAWGMALLASLSGLTFQILTLSFAYHPVMWISLGLVAAWSSSVRAHEPGFRVKMYWRDLLICGVMAILFAFVILPVFLKFKGFL